MEMMEIIRGLHLKCLVLVLARRVCLFSFSSRIVNTSELQLQTDEFKSAGSVGVSSERGSRGVSITFLCSWWWPDLTVRILFGHLMSTGGPDKHNYLPALFSWNITYRTDDCVDQNVATDLWLGTNTEIWLIMTRGIMGAVRTIRHHGHHLGNLSMKSAWKSGNFGWRQE